MLLYLSLRLVLLVAKVCFWKPPPGNDLAELENSANNHDDDDDADANDGDIESDGDDDNSEQLL